MEKDLARTDDEVSRLILHSCHEMGVTPQAAQLMVERCLANRRKPGARSRVEQPPRSPESVT